MLWQNLNTIGQSILLNFQERIFECIEHSNPDKNYFAVKQNGDFYYSTQVLFPLMNGILCFDSDPQVIHTKCEALKNRFKGKNYPLTWIWPHDIDLPQPVESIFTKQGFQSMGKFISVAVEGEKIRSLPIKMNNSITIRLVTDDKQFKAFMQIIKNVYNLCDISLATMSRFYSAYKFSNKIKLYLAEVDSKPAATLLSFHNKNILGLYKGATLPAYRGQGLLTALMINAAKNVPDANYVVAQLMSAQNARGVCNNLGFKEYAHYIPLCYGYDLKTISL